MMQDEFADPAEVGLLGPETEVPDPERGSDLFEEPRGTHLNP